MESKDGKFGEVHAQPEQGREKARGLAVRPQAAARAMDELRASVQAGAVDRSGLMSGARLSKAVVLEQVRDFGFTSDSSLLSNPATYAAYRSLKLEVEGVTLGPDQVVSAFPELISLVQSVLQRHPEVTSVSELWRTAPSVYRELRANPHARLIAWAAGIPRDRADLLYWTDEQLLDAASEYATLTELKYGGGEVHRHIMGRGLLGQLLARRPEMAGEFRVGLGGHRYRSLPELLLGNWFEIRGVEVIREYEVGVFLPGSSRSLIADFKILFPNQVDGSKSGLLIEILQSGGEGRGSVGRSYARRWRAKLTAYRRAGIVPIAIRSDLDYDHGIFLGDRFAARARDTLLSHGIDLGQVPPLNQLMFEDVAIKQALLNLSLEDVLPFINRMGITSPTVLQQKFCWVMTCLRCRHDFDLIAERLRGYAAVRRARAIRETRERQRRTYAPLERVVELCRAHRIGTSSAWFEFAAANRALLKQLRVPSNLPSVYAKLGSWTTWSDLWRR